MSGYCNECGNTLCICKLVFSRGLLDEKLTCPDESQLEHIPSNIAPQYTAPREFKISRANLDCEDVICDIDRIHNFPGRDFIHVVENSVYLIACKERDAYAKSLNEVSNDVITLTEKCDRLRAALEWITENIGCIPTCSKKEDCYRGCDAVRKAEQALDGEE